MKRVAKIADQSIKNRKSTPFWSWLRGRLAAVNRDGTTPPPGIAPADGKVSGIFMIILLTNVIFQVYMAKSSSISKHASGARHGRAECARRRQSSALR